MSDQREALLKLQMDAIGVCEQVLYGDFRNMLGPAGHADVAWDSFWFLTEAIRQSNARLAESIRRRSPPDDLDEALTIGVRLCHENRRDLRRLF